MKRVSEPTDGGPNGATRTGRAVMFSEQGPRATAPGGPAAGEAQSARLRASEAGRERDDHGHHLKDFDTKLGSIQEVLAKYQAERHAQAKGLPVSSQAQAGEDHQHRQQQQQQQRHAASGSGSGRRWRPKVTRKLEAATVLDEEVFVQHVLATPRRVRSAVPGASRALSARIEYYRCHLDKAQEKAERAREEQRAALRESTGGAAGAVAGSQINFIEANRRSIVPYALPHGIQMTLESLRDQGLHSMGAYRRPGSSASGAGYDTSRTSNSGGRPWSAMPGSVRSSQSVPYPGGAGAGAVNRAGTWTGGGTAPTPAAGAVHTAWTASVELPADFGQAPQRSGGSASSSAGGRGGGMLPLAAEPTSRSQHSLSGGGEEMYGNGSGSRGGSPTLFLTAVDVPASRGDAGGNRSTSGAAGPSDSSSHPYGVHGSAQPPSSARPSTATGTARGHMSLSVVVPSRPSTAGCSTGGAGTLLRTPYSSTATTSHGGMRPSYSSTGDGSASLYGGVDPRRLRLALSSRPASGGSPTRRVEFIAEQTARRTERAIYAMEVRERAIALDLERRRNIAQAAELRAAQRREEEERAARVRADAEKHERQRQWTGIVGLCSKLSFLAEQVVEDRRLRALRALQKESAVKIADWYKSVLIRRRQRELVELIQRLKDLIKPYIAMQRVVVRQRCAMRIVAFMQYTRTSNMAVVGVRKLKAGVDFLQTAWRNALLVRNLQRAALYNQLTRLEREIVTTNKRMERNLQTQLMRLGKSVNIMEPDAALMPLGFGSFRSHRSGTSFRAPNMTALLSGLGANGNNGYNGSYGDADSGGAEGWGGGGGGGGGAAEGNRRVSTVNTRQYDRSRQPPRGVLHEGAADEDDEVLRGHLEMVPREVREQIVESFLIEARREHRRLLEQYSADKQLYQARKPIEEMRQKMLRDAGLNVEPEIKPPVMPHMRIIYPRSKLRELLRRAVEINQARLAAAEERRQQEAAAAAAGGGGGGNGHSWLYAERPGGGVAWADQAGGTTSGGLTASGERQRSLAGMHGSVSRGTLVRRSASRASLKGVSHKSIRVSPPSPLLASPLPASSQPS